MMTLNKFNKKIIVCIVFQLMFFSLTSLFSQNLINEFKFDNCYLSELDLSEDGSIIAFIGYNATKDGKIDFDKIIAKIKIYDLNTKLVIFNKNINNTSIYSIRINNDNSLFAFGGWAVPSIEIWNIRTGNQVNTLYSQPRYQYNVNQVFFYRNNCILFSAGHFIYDDAQLYSYNYFENTIDTILFRKHSCSANFKFQQKFNTVLFRDSKCADDDSERPDYTEVIDITTNKILLREKEYDFFKTKFLLNEPAFITFKDGKLIKKNWLTGMIQEISDINIDIKRIIVMFDDQVLGLQAKSKLYFFDLKNKKVFDSICFQNEITFTDYSEDSKRLALILGNHYAKVYSLNNIQEYLQSVDYAIPVSEKENPDRYALIIGNEDYSSFQMGLENESNVPYAKNDALIFKKYAINVLEVPEQNIILDINASAIKMHRDIEKINKIIKNSNGTAEVFVYYAGHGFPNEKTKKPYLIPVDVTATDLKFAVELNYLFDKLTEYPAKRVTVFLDACFSGGGRNKSLLATRAPAIKYEESILKGNIVVFSASSGTQSALSYKEKRHGMFTYYLLKKLQETKGNICYGDFFNYLNKKVGIKSVIINEKEQNPCISVGMDIQNNWNQINLKNGN